MKKIVFVLASALFCGLFTVAGAQGFSYEGEAQVLNDLGLYRGVGSTNFELDMAESVNRETGAVVLLRIFGLEEEALALENVDSILSQFPDANEISDWAKSTVAYAVEKGLVVAEPDGTFGPKRALSGKAYCSMILRQLGYTPDYSRSTAELAERGGLSATEALRFSDKALIKDDLIGISYGALGARSAEGEVVINELIDEGVVAAADAQPVLREIEESENSLPTDQGMATADFVVYGAKIDDRDRLVYYIGNIGPSAEGPLLQLPEQVRLVYEWRSGERVRESFIDEIHSNILPAPASQSFQELFRSDRAILEEHPEFWEGLMIDSQNSPELADFVASKPFWGESVLRVTLDPVNRLPETDGQNNYAEASPIGRPNLAIEDARFERGVLTFSVVNTGDAPRGSTESLDGSVSWKNPGEGASRQSLIYLGGVSLKRGEKTLFSSVDSPALKNLLKEYYWYDTDGVVPISISLETMPQEIDVKDNRVVVNAPAYAELAISEFKVDSIAPVKISYSIYNGGNLPSLPVRASLKFTENGAARGYEFIDLPTIEAGREYREEGLLLDLEGSASEATEITLTVDPENLENEHLSHRTNNVKTTELRLADLAIDSLVFDKDIVRARVSNLDPAASPAGTKVVFFWKNAVRQTIPLPDGRDQMEYALDLTGRDVYEFETSLGYPERASTLFAQVEYDYPEKSKSNNITYFDAQLPDFVIVSPSSDSAGISLRIANRSQFAGTASGSNLASEWQNQYGEKISDGNTTAGDRLDLAPDGETDPILLPWEFFGNRPSGARYLNLTLSSGVGERAISNNHARFDLSSSEERSPADLAEDALSNDQRVAEAELVGRSAEDAPPTIKSNSPFSFLKEISRKTKEIFTFKDEKKAESLRDYANEKLVEAVELLKEGESQQAGEVLAEYRDDIISFDKLADELRVKDPVLHARLLEKSVRDKIKQGLLLSTVKSESRFEQTRKELVDDLASALSLMSYDAAEKILSDSIYLGGSSLAKTSSLGLLQDIRKEVQGDDLDKLLGELIERSRAELANNINSLVAVDKTKIAEAYWDLVGREGELPDISQVATTKTAPLDLSGGESAIAMCALDFNPVCGKDGKTYSNSCFLSKAGVELLKKGECPKSPTDSSKSPDASSGQPTKDFPPVNQAEPSTDRKPTQSAPASPPPAQVVTVPVPEASVEVVPEAPEDKIPSFTIKLQNTGPTYTISGKIDYYAKIDRCAGPRASNPVIIRWGDGADEPKVANNTFSASHQYKVNQSYEISVSVYNKCYQMKTERRSVGQ